MKTIENQFVAYALQRNKVKATNEVVHFIFFKSSLWTHSAQMTEYEFKDIFDKISYKKQETTESETCIVENWDIIHATARN